MHRCSYGVAGCIAAIAGYIASFNSIDSELTRIQVHADGAASVAASNGASDVDETRAAKRSKQQHSDCTLPEGSAGVTRDPSSDKVTERYKHLTSLQQAVLQLDMVTLMSTSVTRDAANALLDILQSEHTASSSVNPTSSQSVETQVTCPLTVFADHSASTATADNHALGYTTAAVAVKPPMALHEFLSQHMETNTPVVIRGAMQHWPAMTKWQSTDYLKQTAGTRTVPVEVCTALKSNSNDTECVDDHELLVVMRSQSAE